MTDTTASGGVLSAAAVALVPPGALALRVAAPTSKSATNRLLAVAALARGTSTINAPLDSDDARAMRRVVTALGATVTDVMPAPPAAISAPPGREAISAPPGREAISAPPAREATIWSIQGVGGKVVTPADPIDCAQSGTALRFGTALAALAAGPVTLTGDAPLLRRPIGPLVVALAGLGAAAADNAGYPPVTAGGGLRGGVADVDVTASSQFASALLLASPYATAPVTVRPRGRAARAYIDLTVDVMQRWGAAVAANGDGWLVEPGGYSARADTVEYDASSAAHLLAIAVATGGEVTVVNTTPTRQPDAMILDVLRMMGASVTGAGGGTTVIGPAVPEPIDVNVAAMPDQVTTIAALAALAPGTSVIRGAGVTRGHETDRLAALAAELGKLGVDVEERPDGLVISGGNARGPARLHTYDDHRLAMAFAAIAARVPDVLIEHPGCVTKTYPTFWDDLAAAGISVRPVA